VFAVHAILSRLQSHHHHQLGIELHHLLPVSTPVSAPAAAAGVQYGVLPPVQRNDDIIR